MAVPQRSKRKTRLLEITLVVLVMVAVYGIGSPWLHRRRVRAHEEGCRRNLQALWQAIMEYRRENGGFPPIGYDVLYPKYVKDPAIFICPGDRRPGKENRKWRVPCSYMFPLSTLAVSPERQALLKRRGEDCPLVLCGIHSTQARQDFDREPFYLFVRVNGCGASVVIRATHWWQWQPAATGHLLLLGIVAAGCLR